MALETATYISDLNASNPAHTDGLNQADSHLRLIKNVIKTTLPNINGVVNATDEQLNTLSTALTAGLGFTPTGMMAPFPKTTAISGWLRCNGATYNNVDYPTLAACLAQGGSTFVVPQFEDTGRFVRSVTSGLAVGTAQANALKSHTHTNSASSPASSSSSSSASTTASATTTASGTTDTQGNHAHNATGVTNTAGAHTHTTSASGSTDTVAAHTHTVSGTSGNDNVDHTHAFTTDAGGTHHHTNATRNNYASVTAGASTAVSNLWQLEANVASSDDGSHTHTGTTGGRLAFHQHDFSATTASGGSHSHAVTTTGAAASAGDHSHTVSTLSEFAGSHSHNLNISASTSVTASTTVATTTTTTVTPTVTINATGDTETRPESYAAVWFIKT